MVTAPGGGNEATWPRALLRYRNTEKNKGVFARAREEKNSRAEIPFLFGESKVREKFQGTERKKKKKNQTKTPKKKKKKKKKKKNPTQNKKKNTRKIKKKKKQKGKKT